MVPQTAAEAQLSQPTSPFGRSSSHVGINIPEDNDQQIHRLPSLGYLQLRLLPALTPECSPFDLSKDALQKAVARENLRLRLPKQLYLDRQCSTCRIVYT